MTAIRWHIFKQLAQNFPKHTQRPACIDFSLMCFLTFLSVCMGQAWMHACMCMCVCVFYLLVPHHFSDNYLNGALLCIWVNKFNTLTSCKAKVSKVSDQTIMGDPATHCQPQKYTVAKKDPLREVGWPLGIERAISKSNKCHGFCNQLKHTSTFDCLAPG